jgi:hypothetical protein
MKLILVNRKGNKRDFFEGSDKECYETMIGYDGVYIDEEGYKWYINFDF